MFKQRVMRFTSVAVWRANARELGFTVQEDKEEAGVFDGYLVARDTAGEPVGAILNSLPLVNIHNRGWMLVNR